MWEKSHWKYKSSKSTGIFKSQRRGLLMAYTSLKRQIWSWIVDVLLWGQRKKTLPFNNSKTSIPKGKKASTPSPFKVEITDTKI